MALNETLETAICNLEANDEQRIDELTKGSGTRKKLKSKINTRPGGVYVIGPKIVPSVEGQFRIYQLRRTILINALTTDIHKLQSDIQFQSYSNSDSDICLHVLYDGNWKVAPFGIEAAAGVILPKEKDKDNEDWLSIVAGRCDAWLLSGALYGFNGHFTKANRRVLYKMIKELPTIHEITSKKKVTDEE